MAFDMFREANAPGLARTDEFLQARFPLLERQRLERLAVDPKQVEYEIDQRSAIARADVFCSAWKLVRPSGNTIAASPSISASSSASLWTASAISGNAAVQSLPLRV